MSRLINPWWDSDEELPVEAAPHRRQDAGYPARRATDRRISAAQSEDMEELEDFLVSEAASRQEQGPNLRRRASDRQDMTEKEYPEE
jgi:hypothetical protein